MWPGIRTKTLGGTAHGDADEAIEKPQSIRFDASEHRDRHPQEYYDEIKARFAAERDLRLAYRPPGTALYTSELAGRAGPRTQVDPYAGEPEPREPITDHVEVLFIGGGFSALLTSARLRERGVESIRIVERGADVGGTWYWNRYPGIACDVVSYDYLPLLDEMQYVPSKHYAEGPEIFAHCQAIARRYDLYELAVFQTTVTSTVWDEAERHWVVTTDRGDRMTAHVRDLRQRHAGQAAPGDHRRHGDVRGHVVPHVALGLRVHRARTSSTSTTRSSGSSAPAPAPCRSCPTSAQTAKELYVFQRTPSSIDVRDDWPTDPEWAAQPAAGLADQAAGARSSPRSATTAERNKALRDGITREEKIRRQENANIDAMMRIHRRIDETVEDPATADVAEALVHDHVQAAVLPQRLPADVQPAQRPPRRHPRRGDHEDRPEGPGVPRRGRTSSTC